MKPVYSLSQFCNSIGISPNEVKEAESLSRYHLLTTVSSNDIQQLSLDSLKALGDSFKAALCLEIGVPDGPAVLQTQDGRVPPDIDDALARVKQLGGDVQVDLTLDKHVILEQHDLDDDTYHAILYIFKRNLLTGLDAALLDLDKHIFEGRYKRAVILLLEDDFYYKGEFLVVVSPDHLPKIAESLEPISSSLQRRVDRYHQVAFDNLNWVGFQFKHLTPLHFLCVEQNETAKDLSSILRRHLFQVAILYTATRSVHQAGSFLVDYASSEQTITLAFTPDPIPESKSDALLRFVLWPYASAKTDRLTIFQAVAARELQTLDHEENYRSFVRQIDHILHEARWNHRVYITGEINKHFEQVQNVASYISDVAEDISDAVDAITKGLTETLLATIGVVITSFLAALIKGETSAPLFKLSMQVYIGYIGFQLIYRMGGILYSHCVLKADSREQLQTYENVLGKGKVAELTLPVRRHNLQFYIWFGITILIYIVLAAGMWRASGGFTSYLAEIGAISPIATPTVLPSTITPAP